VAEGWLWVPNWLPIGYLPNGFGVALRWLCTPESMPSICLLYGFVVALGGFDGPLAPISAFHFMLSAFAGVWP
jgi:hypothetical protein